MGIRLAADTASASAQAAARRLGPSALLRPTAGQACPNEVNTIPDVIPTSHYPKLWAASDLPDENLLDHLIEPALERHADKAQLTTDATMPRPVA